VKGAIWCEVILLFILANNFMENHNNNIEKKQTGFKKNMMPFLILIGILIVVTVVLNFVLKAIL